jgi:hypothetical protein
MKAHPEMFPWFFGIWIALSLVGGWLMYFDEDIARKKRLLPVFTIGTGIIFLVFTFLMMPTMNVMALAVPSVALITWLNLRNIRVCSTCGKTIHTGVGFTKAEYCPKCGARLS